MVAVIAHRGASAVAPENTLAAFETATAMGADGIELDCQLSKDGHLVVIHDPTLERTTGRSGLVKDFTLAELKQLDAGAWFDQRFRGERIPALAEVFELLRDRCRVNVELKTLPIRYDGIEEALVALLRKTDYPLDNLIVSSFDHVSLLRLQSLEPRIAIAALFSHYPTSLASLPGTILHPHWGVVDSKLVAKARLAGRAVNVWTANEPRVWSHLVACGVNGIVTDHPDQLQEWLDEQC